MKSDFVIIGGGVAGLAAVNRLAEMGCEVTLLEAGVYPSHKVCGEFLSPEALPILEKWEIIPEAFIHSVKMVWPQKQWCMELPKKAGSMKRFVLDEMLAKRAGRLGAAVQTKTEVQSIQVPKRAGEPYCITLATGETYFAKTLLMCAGRLLSTLAGRPPPSFCYIGVKAHFEGVLPPGQLLMHLMPGAYFGMSSVGNGHVNVAGLIACTANEAKNPKTTFDHFLKQKESQNFVECIKPWRLLFDDWLITPVPEFGVRSSPGFPNAFFLGDAAGVIPPATGDGLAMGLTSGLLAAEYAITGDSAGYKARWKRDFARRIVLGKLLHRLFLSKHFSQLIPSAASLFPALPRAVFSSTRG